jgi:hypothetical protein
LKRVVGASGFVPRPRACAEQLDYQRGNQGPRLRQDFEIAIIGGLTEHGYSLDVEARLEAAVLAFSLFREFFATVMSSASGVQKR